MSDVIPLLFQLPVRRENTRTGCDLLWQVPVVQISVVFGAGDLQPGVRRGVDERKRSTGPHDGQYKETGAGGNYQTERI